MGLFNDVGDQRTRPGPRGPGFEEDGNRNFHVEGKKLKNLRRRESEKEAANEKHVGSILAGIGNLVKIGRWVGSLKRLWS